MRLLMLYQWKIPENTIGFPIIDLQLQINNRDINSRLGVYIIKEYTLYKNTPVSFVIKLLSKGGFDIPTEGLEALKKAIRAFESSDTKKIN